MKKQIDRLYNMVVALQDVTSNLKRLIEIQDAEIKELQKKVAESEFRIQQIRRFGVNG